jgi:probable rRNA maturation factor
MKDHKKSSFLLKPGISCDVNFGADIDLSYHRQGQCRLLIHSVLKELQAFLTDSWKSCGGQRLPQSIDISLSLVGQKRMMVINHQFRQKKKTTDVLSFPLYDQLRSTKTVLPELFCLGDVVICWPVLQHQAEQFDLPWSKEFLYLFIHGVLHLLDFDHERGGAEESLMFHWEEILAEKSWVRYQKSAGQKERIKV